MVLVVKYVYTFILLFHFDHQGAVALTPPHWPSEVRLGAAREMLKALLSSSPVLQRDDLSVVVVLKTVRVKKKKWGERHVI